VKFVVECQYNEENPKWFVLRDSDHLAFCYGYVDEVWLSRKEILSKIRVRHGDVVCFTWEKNFTKTHDWMKEGF